MDNIVGYICSTPWGTVSRTTPSLGWTPVLPAIPDGWQDAGTGAAPTGFRIIVRPGTRFPTLFPKLPPEYLRLPALIHEGLTQQMPDYAAAVWRLEGLLGRELSGALDEAACVAAYAALGLPGKVEKAKGVP